MSTSTKLTWLSLDCLNSANGYVKAQKESVDIIEKLTAQIPIIDLGISAENANKIEMQKKIDDTTLRLNEAKTKLAAATREADKKTLTSAVGAWTSAGRSYTTALNKITLNIKKLEAAKLAATNQPTALKADLANTKSNAQLICTKGF